MNVTLKDIDNPVKNQIYKNITDDDLTQEHCDIVKQIFTDVCLFKIYTKDLEIKLRNILQYHFPKVSKFKLIYSPNGHTQLTFGNVLSTIKPTKTYKTLFKK